ncbi:MAG: hypothetical protein AAB589_02915 [Patescibacteria group bacterium]
MQNSRFLKWILALAIVIVLNLFFNYAIHLVYEAPQWENFCPTKQVNIMPQTKEACLDEGGSWTEENGEMITTIPLFGPGDSAPRRTSYCDVNFTCDREFDSYQSVYNRNVFLILVGAGLATLLLSLFVALTSPVSLGLSLGGVLSIIVGSIRYWSEMQDYLRVILLAVALILLIWLGIKKFRE